MMGMGFHELLAVIAIIAALSLTGLWPEIIRGLRELRGEKVDPPSTPATAQDLEVCYKMLGVSPSASLEAVEQAYRQKAKLHHPDRGGDPDTMRALNEAYALIKKARRGTHP